MPGVLFLWRHQGDVAPVSSRLPVFPSSAKLAHPCASSLIDRGSNQLLEIRKLKTSVKWTVNLIASNINYGMASCWSHLLIF